MGAGMKFETSMNRIEKLAAEKEDENWKFRCFLKGWCELSNEEIDELFHRFAEEVTREIDCTQCANCCREVKPLLQARDIERLANFLGMSLTSFCEKHLIESEDEEGFYFNTLPCPFLEGNLCTVYDSRPDDCRSYPHLQKEDRVFCITTIFSNCSVCPIIYNVYELLKNELWDPEQMEAFPRFGFD
jgi:Fe-S-cluster containining protein